MLLKRKLYQQLLDWKHNNNGSTALLIEGARRVGKSHIVEQFAKNEYKSSIIIDFANTRKELRLLFEETTGNMDLFFSQLSVLYGTPLYQRESLIAFDEVQQFPKARQLIKYLVADGKYDYIETGSLLSLKQNIKDIVLPSEEERILMYPLDFEEFLWALDDKVTADYIKDCFANKKPTGAVVHRKILNTFRQYILVGGMPQAVKEYAATKDFEKVDRIKKGILQLYRNDVAKFAEGYESKVLSVFDEIPSQLSLHEKSFRLSAINKDARFRTYEDAFVWLSEAMITANCFNTNDPSLGLTLNTDRLKLKCYMQDTGLLISHTFADKNFIDNKLYQAILFDRLNINEGMIIENIVAQMLLTKGHKLFYYSRPKNEAESALEIDFLISNDNKISPIEVKSSNYTTQKSLDRFKQKFTNRIGQPYIIYTKDLQIKSDTLCIPVYMTMCL